MTDELEVTKLAHRLLVEENVRQEWSLLRIYETSAESETRILAAEGLKPEDQHA